VLILNAAEVRRALPMRQAVEAMKTAFAALSNGHAHIPHRTHLPVARHAGVSLIMPALVDDPAAGVEALTVKVVSVYDNNQAQGMARIQAAVLVLDPATGRPTALLEGATLTAIRTAAASGAATDFLARKESRKLALFGAGVEARTHLEAMCAVRRIDEVRVYSRTPDKVAAMIAEFEERQREQETGATRPASGAAKQQGARCTARLIAAQTPQEALAGADIVCATTTSKAPVFEDADLPPGVHINTVGSYTRDAREIPGETVRRAMVVVDSRDAAWQEAGDLIQPLGMGMINRDHIHAELGELVLSRKSGRTDDRQITLFKSVGLAVQDAVAARCVLDNASRLKLGREIEW
jgi:ornithine cyclodeaminase/alanine dehydrogenase-like protein (mu-crystallin family)